MVALSGIEPEFSPWKGDELNLLFDSAYLILVSKSGLGRGKYLGEHLILRTHTPWSWWWYFSNAGLVTSSLFLVGEEGFEPSLPDPKSEVLPLHYSPVQFQMFFGLISIATSCNAGPVNSNIVRGMKLPSTMHSPRPSVEAIPSFQLKPSPPHHPAFSYGTRASLTSHNHQKAKVTPICPSYRQS